MKNIVNLSLLPCSLTNYKDKKRVRKYAHIDLDGRQVIFSPGKLVPPLEANAYPQPYPNPSGGYCHLHLVHHFVH